MKQVLQLILITLDTSFLMVSIATRVWEKRSQFFPFNTQRQARETLVPIFYIFGMTQPGFEPATSRTRSGRSTTRLSRQSGHLTRLWSLGMWTSKCPISISRMIIFSCHELFFKQLGKGEAFSDAWGGARWRGEVVFSFVIKNIISSADNEATEINFSCLHLAFKLLQH